MTLGGTGKQHGDRHPKVSDNVLIGASATVLGNIRVGEGAQIAAGSLVLKPVPPHTMVAGSPAKQVGTVTGAAQVVSCQAVVFLWSQQVQWEFVEGVVACRCCQQQAAAAELQVRCAGAVASADVFYWDAVQAAI